MSDKIKSILRRFAKGFIAGAITAMTAVPVIMPSDWSGFLPILNALAIAGVFGGMVGVLLAIEKWASWKD